MLEIGKLGGKATAEIFHAGKGLHPDELPALVTHAAAQEWLETIGRAVASGRLRDRDAVAATRAVEAWLKAHADAISNEVVTKLRARIEELEGELQRSKVRAIR